MTAMERMQQQAAALRALLASSNEEGGKAMDGGAPVAGPPPGAPVAAAAGPAQAAPMPPPKRPAKAPAAPPPGPGGSQDEPDGDEDDPDLGDDDGDEPPEAGKAIGLPAGTEAVTLIDGAQFMEHLKAVVAGAVEERMAAFRGEINKALDALNEAAGLQMEALGEVGKSVGAMRLQPSAIPTRPGAAVPNRRTGTDSGPISARLPPRPDPLAGLAERVKAMPEAEAERVLLPLIFKGKITAGEAQALKDGRIPATAKNDALEAVKAALDD